MRIKYKYLTELLEAADSIEDGEERAQFMKENMREPVRQVLAAIHNPDIQFYCPKNLVYRTNRNKLGVADTNLDMECKRIYIFQKSNPLSEERKKARLTQLLESMAPEESNFLYESVLQKKNPFKNINKNFIKKHFQEILILSIDR